MRIYSRHDVHTRILQPIIERWRQDATPIVTTFQLYCFNHNEQTIKKVATDDNTANMLFLSVQR